MLSTLNSRTPRATHSPVELFRFWYRRNVNFSFHKASLSSARPTLRWFALGRASLADPARVAVHRMPRDRNQGNTAIGAAGSGGVRAPLAEGIKAKARGLFSRMAAPAAGGGNGGGGGGGGGRRGRYSKTFEEEHSWKQPLLVKVRFPLRQRKMVLFLCAECGISGSAACPCCLMRFPDLLSRPGSLANPHAIVWTLLVRRPFTGG